MGTAPFNFPPENVVPVGSSLTGNKLSLTASLANTVFFTAPTPGLYLVAMALRIRTTNGAGTLAATLHTPHAGNISLAVAHDTVAVTAIEKDLAPAGPTDGYSAAVPVWMDAGDTVGVETTAAGLTGTTYDVYVAALRVF